MSLLHKAITLSGACAIGLTHAFAAPAAAEDDKPINFRAVGGAVLGGTWNVGLTGSASWSTTAIPAAPSTCCRALRSATPSALNRTPPTSP
ncbi:MAG: hypothetical protein ACLT2T_17495 [Bilophila wadsworthia]